jgi:hypothetical protein
MSTLAIIVLVYGIPALVLRAFLLWMADLVGQKEEWLNNPVFELGLRYLPFIPVLNTVILVMGILYALWSAIQWPFRKLVEWFLVRKAKKLIKRIKDKYNIKD